MGAVVSGVSPYRCTQLLSSRRSLGDGLRTGSSALGGLDGPFPTLDVSDTFRMAHEHQQRRSSVAEDRRWVVDPAWDTALNCTLSMLSLGRSVRAGYTQSGTGSVIDVK